MVLVLVAVLRPLLLSTLLAPPLVLLLLPLPVDLPIVPGIPTPPALPQDINAILSAQDAIRVPLLFVVPKQLARLKATPVGSTPPSQTLTI